MAEAEIREKKTDKKADRVARRAEARAAKLREAEEFQARTRRQLEAATVAVTKIEEEIAATHRAEARRTALSSHLGGFYSEIDKLTRGKALLPVTDLLVDTINEIVRDAKAIVSGDTYLDRVREFVPAGDNPVYPDVLVKARTVMESLSRFKQTLEAGQKRAEKVFREARTVQVATQHYLENGFVPTKGDIQEALGGQFVPSTWFVADVETGEETFNFDKLDDCDVKSYFNITNSPGETCE